MQNNLSLEESGRHKELVVTEFEALETKAEPQELKV
jgi:hypothetical protein